MGLSPCSHISEGISCIIMNGTLIRGKPATVVSMARALLVACSPQVFYSNEQTCQMRRASHVARRASRYVALMFCYS
jgi:hypothetical protein